MLTAFTPLLRYGLRSLLGWLDERTQAPIMRQYINEGSRRYFHDERTERGASDLDELLAGPAWTEFPIGRSAKHGADTPTARASRTAWLRVLSYVALGAVAVLWLLAASGHGPFARVSVAASGTRLGQGMFGTIGLWLSLRRGSRALQEARDLARVKRVLRPTASPSTPPDRDRHTRDDR